MAIGDNIRRMRMLRGLTQKELGLAIGFDQKTADVRIAQYESGTRTPKEKMILDLAQVFGVRPEALTTSDIDTYVGLMHTLFTLEDVYGLKIGEIEGELCLRLDRHNKSYPSMFDMFHAWQQQAQKLRDEELSDEGYNQWRYNYPQGEQEKLLSFCYLMAKKSPKNLDSSRFSGHKCLFPLNRSTRLRAHIIAHTVDILYFL